MSALLEQRIKSLESRVVTLEGTDRDDLKAESKRYGAILEKIADVSERLARLETRMALIAGGAGVVSSVLVLAIKGIAG